LDRAGSHDNGDAQERKSYATGAKGAEQACRTEK
jgi:hypothetical protein